MTALATLLATSPYTAYSYAYPHKTAYRPLDPPADLATVWEREDKQALFLYWHIPFCEMRCGFCNLFTQTQAGEDIVSAYLDTLAREVKQVKSALGSVSFARMAIGGGTPTFLNAEELARLFDLAIDLGAEPLKIPVSLEVSPQTATNEKLTLLKQWGVDRISIGIQSFIPAETAAAGRPQAVEDVYAALDRIRAIDFPTLNLDLIYGLPGQSIESWQQSLQIALKFAPEELYLYPLYVRPLTGLGRSARAWNDERRDYYRHARDFLLASGYEQVSMRMFRRHTPAPVDLSAPLYCCQSDGMLGLGCGARSYTSALHYSSEYAVGMQGVRDIINHYIAKTDDRFQTIDYGYRLNLTDRQRRFIIQSLLQFDGLDFTAYCDTFGSDPLTDFPQLNELFELELAVWNEGERERGMEIQKISIFNSQQSKILSCLAAWCASLRRATARSGAVWAGVPPIQLHQESASAFRVGKPDGREPQNPKSKILLNAGGMELSDTIGAWLYSTQVKALMEDYTWR